MFYAVIRSLLVWWSFLCIRTYSAWLQFVPHSHASRLTQVKNYLIYEQVAAGNEVESNREFSPG
jgi:hypothetical protein